MAFLAPDSKMGCCGKEWNLTYYSIGKRQRAEGTLRCRRTVGAKAKSTAIGKTVHPGDKADGTKSDGLNMPVDCDIASIISTNESNICLSVLDYTLTVSHVTLYPNGYNSTHG